MADIHIERAHALGLKEARRIALQWAEKAQTDFGMSWTCEQGTTGDLLSFSRSGVSGTLALTKSSFEMDARLGFLASMFKDRIEAEIVKNLDALLSENSAVSEVGSERADAKAKNG